MSHFSDSAALGSLVWMPSANIFLAYKDEYTLQQLMKQSKAVGNRIFTWIIHRPVCLREALGRDISWRKLETQVNISDLANRRSFHLVKDGRSCLRNAFFYSLVWQTENRKDNICNIFTAAAFPKISVISSTARRHDNHFKGKLLKHSAGIQRLTQSPGSTEYLH